MSALQEAIDELYGVPFETFVSERQRLAKALRGKGDRDGAAALGKLSKPSAAAWALNYVAREDPEAMASWLEVAGALRETSMHSAAFGGEAVRDAMAAHRDATVTLLTTVRDIAQPGGKVLSPPMLERARTLLQGATVDAATAELLRAGRISEDRDAPVPIPRVEGDDDDATDEPVAAAPAAEPAADANAERDAGRKKRTLKERAEELELQRRAKERAAAEKAAPERIAAERAKQRAELEARVEAAEELVEERRKHASERARAAEDAADRLENARRSLTRAESEHEAAHSALGDAHAAIAAARAELKDLRAMLRSS